MKKILLTVLRVVALVVIYMVLFTIGSRLTNPPDMSQSFTPEQLNQAMVAIPLVSLIMTLMLTYLALRSRWHGWKLGAALALILFTLYTFLAWIELLAFPAVSSRMPKEMLMGGMLIDGLIVAVPFSLLAVWILGRTGTENTEDEVTDRLQMPASEWIWKLAAAAALYVIVYFTFGYFVAWRTPGLPAFYGGSDPGTFLGQLANVLRDTPWLYPFQFLRGLIWAGIGCIIIRMHKGKAWETILATGLSFAVVMNVSLLFPNPFMPPFVAHAHMIELVSSNFLYGTLLSILMLWGSLKHPRMNGAVHPAN